MSLVIEKQAGNFFVNVRCRASIISEQSLLFGNFCNFKTENGANIIKNVLFSIYL
jgi:hypothetical protein